MYGGLSVFFPVYEVGEIGSIPKWHGIINFSQTRLKRALTRPIRLSVVCGIDTGGSSNARVLRREIAQSRYCVLLYVTLSPSLN